MSFSISQYFLPYLDSKLCPEDYFDIREMEEYYIYVDFIWWAAGSEGVMIKDQQLHRQGQSFTIIELL